MAKKVLSNSEIQQSQDILNNAKDGHKVNLQSSFGDVQGTSTSLPALATKDGLQPKDNGPHEDSIGVTGSQIIAGYEAEDPNPFLSNRDGYIAFDNMERIDASVYSTTQGQRDKIKEADFYLEPKDDRDPEQSRRAKIASDCFFNKQEKIWLDNLNDILTYFRGHSIFEPVWEEYDYPGEGKVWKVRKLGWKNPRSIWQIFFLNDKVWSARQISYGDDQRYVDIPGNNLLIFSYNHEGNLIRGRSFLRPMYGPTQRKEEYLRTALQGIKVNAKGITTVEIPTGKNNTAEATSMTNALSNFWKGFTNWITHPTGWKLEHKPMDFKAQEVETLLNFENKEITQAGSNKQSQLGQTTRGAQGLHQGMQAESNVSIKVQAVYICKILQKVIDDFYLYNWGPDAIPAELKVEGIDNKADLEEAQKDQVLMAMFPVWVQDPIIMAFMRKKYGYPGGDEIEESGAGPDGTKKDADGNPMSAQPGNTQPTDKTSEINQEAKEHGPMIKQIESDAKANKTKPVQEYAKQIVKAHESKTLKEGDVCDCGSAHIAPTRLSEFTPKRDLTAYENKVQLSELSQHINNFSDKYMAEVRNSFNAYILPRYKKELTAVLDRAITDRQKYTAVIDTKLDKRDKVKQIIKDMIVAQMTKGYIGAKKEIKNKKKLTEPIESIEDLPAGAYGWCAANADILTDTFFDDVQKKLKIKSINGIDNGKTTSQIVFDAVEEAGDYLDKDRNIGAQYISVKALNEGRFNAFQEAKDEIKGFQFSAILETACPLCAELDGKTFKIDDPDSTEYEPPLHPNCNCILVPILMDEESPDKWDGLDESVSDKNEKYKKLSEVK
jgi:SPP1 gp7 family putative phage head morphogenesis protein